MLAYLFSCLCWLGAVLCPWVCECVSKTVLRGSCCHSCVLLLQELDPRLWPSEVSCDNQSLLFLSSPADGGGSPGSILPLLRVPLGCKARTSDRGPDCKDRRQED